VLLMAGATARIIGRFGLKAPLVAGLAVLAGGIGLLGLTQPFSRVGTVEAAARRLD
jgi:hypothetical protein